MRRKRGGWLERIPFRWNGICSTFFVVTHVLIGKPVSTFPGHALSQGGMTYLPIVIPLYIIGGA